MVETRRRRRKERPRISETITRLLPYLHLWSNRREIIGMPTPPVHYLALSYNIDSVHDWCNRHGIKPRSVRVVQGMREARGIGDFYLIVFGGWMDSAGDDKLAAGEYLMKRAKDVFFADTHKPVVNGQGIITRWERSDNDNGRGSY